MLVSIFILCSAACGATTTRVVRHGQPPAWLLTRARLAARALGDSHPQEIDLFATGPNLKIRLWGRFRCLACSVPYGHRAITGDVATYVYRGRSQELSSFSLAPRRIVVAADRAAPVVREWRNELIRGAKTRPRRRFPSPGLAVLRSRLERASRRYGFTLERIELRRPRQLAPQITIRSPYRAQLAHTLGPIIDLIDPPARSNDRAYEGILVEAVDEREVPFAIAWNALRGKVAGGQWASAPSLYPFSHG